MSAKIDLKNNNPKISKVYHFTVKGLRETNEDSHIIFNNDKFVIYGVCDGHGGSQVSHFICKIIPEIFTAQDFKHPLNSQFVKKVFEKIQQSLKTAKSLHAFDAGCTCTLFFKYHNSDDFYTINLGDSRIIGCYKTIKTTQPNKTINYSTIQFTKDHKPHDQEEAKLITSLGGKIEVIEGIYRINGLSLSRSFGDLDNPYISCKPDIKNYKTIYKTNNQIKKLMFIIIGCDGLYDNLDNELIVNHIIRNYYNSDLKRKTKVNNKTKIGEEERRIYTNPAQELCQFALDNESTDNVSTIVIFFDD